MEEMGSRMRVLVSEGYVEGMVKITWTLKTVLGDDESERLVSLGRRGKASGPPGGDSGGEGDIQHERAKDKRDEPSFGMKLREYE